jgi:predicted DNA-binding protein
MLCITNRGEPEILRMPMASQERREQITVPVDAELRQRLEQAAERDHRTIASYVRHVVAQALEQREAAA